MATEFPFQAHANDIQSGYLVVQKMVLFLRDIFDSFTGKFASGSVTVASGTTTVTVAVSINSSSYKVVVTPLADPLARFWVSGKTATQFVINLGAAAPVSGIAFDWIAKGA